MSLGFFHQIIEHSFKQRSSGASSVAAYSLTAVSQDEAVYAKEIF
jgi:hypothetical protein